jgi:hypothetical protein
LDIGITLPIHTSHIGSYQVALTVSPMVGAIGGQHALFVKDGFEALEIYDTDPTAVACILTELKPTEDMTGWQVRHTSPVSRPDATGVETRCSDAKVGNRLR